MLPLLDYAKKRRIKIFACVSVSHPSGARSSWSAMCFGLAVACWLTFEPPALHHTLKTFTNAKCKRGKILSALIFSGYQIFQIKRLVLQSDNEHNGSKNNQVPGENLRFGCDVHVLARTEMCSVQRSAWKHHKRDAKLVSHMIPAHGRYRVTDTWLDESIVWDFKCSEFLFGGNSCTPVNLHLIFWFLSENNEGKKSK